MTYVCPDCRQRVEVKIHAEVICCTKCAQVMILAKAKQENVFLFDEVSPVEILNISRE
jgi:DNA-directed RNA polymerase subunit RPC12/RpoP